MNAEEELAAVFDGVLDAAIEILVERTGRTRAALHELWDGKAYGYLTLDYQHSGRVTLTGRTLANILVPAPVTDVAAQYAAADERRLARKPAGWLEPEAFERVIGEARQALRKTKPANEEGGSR